MAFQNAFNNTLVDGLLVSFSGSATGDIWYRNAGGQMTRLGIGSSGQMLTVAGGIPSWTTGASPGGNAGGDLSGTYPNPAIAADSVTFAKIQNVSTQIILGRNTASTGDLEELSPSTARSVLGLGTAALANTGTSSGNVPVLDGSGKLVASVIPTLAISQTYVVSNQSGRLALSANIGDVAKQTDNGLAYILQATPASTDGNWVSIGDTAIVASDIVSGTISTDRLGSGTANSSSWLRGDQAWAALPYTPLPDNNVSGTSTTMAANNSYRPNNAALCTLTLPTTAALGTIIRVVGVGAGGWRIAQNASQQIFFGNLSSTIGVGGRLDSTHRRDSVTLQCVTANNEFQVIASVGNIDVV
jgi:hypothetical protein